MSVENIIKEIENYIPQNEDEVACQKEMLDFLLTWKEKALTRENTNGHFSASCIVINEQKTKVLFVYHLIYQSWSFIGGHIDNETNLFLVAKKELEEETGTQPFKAYPHMIAIQKLKVPQHYKNHQIIETHYHYDVCFLFMVKESDPIRIKEDENKDVRWLPIDDISSYVSEKHMLPIYEKILRRKNLL